jgi:glycogen debranching enzyme
LVAEARGPTIVGYNWRAMPGDTFEVLAPSETTTLVRGATVAVSSRSGEIRPHALLGIMHRDERLLSAVTVLIDGQIPPLLAADRIGASTDRIASLAALDEYRNGQALLVRRRTVHDDCVTEELELHSFGPEKTVELCVVLESDGASILGLRGGRSPRSSLPWSRSGPSEATSLRRDLPFAFVSANDDAALVVDGPALHLTWKAKIAVDRVWRATWSVRPANLAVNDPPASHIRLRVHGSDRRWAPAIASATADLDALTITLPENNTRFIGAGAPWYQALFGRDSLIAAWQSLPLGTELALDVLDALASRQGTTEDHRTRQAPGKILHELRIGNPQVFGMEAGQAYYGSVDSTPLFVMLLAEAYRWGASPERVRRLLPAARGAVQWCRQQAVMVGSDNRGPLVWYTPDPKGLGNQGWKDSGDCMLHADGTLAEGSLAVAEAQSYVYEALIGLARLERDLGTGEAAASDLEAHAAQLSLAFVEHFWMSHDDLVALAIDEKGAALQVATSNMGQCLWSGILPDEIAARVAARVMAPDLLTPFGIRTLGANERGYNPLGYHLGAVWAHDSAIVAAGLARQGHHQAFRVLTDSLLHAAEQFEWRLPELYGGLDTGTDGIPLPYPAACSPQAWSAGAPLLLMRSALGLYPDVPARFLRVSPAIETGSSLRVDGLRLGGESGNIAVDEHGVVSVTGFSLEVNTP